ECGAEVGEAEVLETPAAVVAGAVERDAGLPGAVGTDEIDALDVDLLGAVEVDSVGAAAAVGLGDCEVSQVKAGGVAGVAGVADNERGAVALVIPDAPAGRSASCAAALVGASVNRAVSDGGRDGDGGRGRQCPAWEQEGLIRVCERGGCVPCEIARASARIADAACGR